MKSFSTTKHATIQMIVGLLLVLSSCYAQATQSPITFVVDDWCPYTCEPHSEKPGIAVEVINAVFGKDNVQFKSMEWRDAINAVEAGQADGLAAALTSDAPFFIFQKSAITTSTICFFVPQTLSWRYKDTTSLNDKNLITVEGFSYGEILDNYIAQTRRTNKNRIVELKDKDVAIQRFAFYQASENNVIVADNRVFNHQLQNYNQYQVPLKFHNGGCLVGEDLHIALSPKNKKRSLTLAHKFELGLQQLKSNGELAKILAKY